MKLQFVCAIALAFATLGCELLLDPNAFPRPVEDAGDACQPASCADQGAECGEIGDGCGETLDCGDCGSPATCGRPGEPNKCQPCMASSCEDLGAECGEIDDGCGQPLDCGGCSGTLTCAGAGTPNKCELCRAPSDRELCVELGWGCGNLIAHDRCGNPRDVECGGCLAGQECVEIATGKECACAPGSCEAGQVCDRESKSCVAGCDATSSCPSGETCDLARGSCVCEEQAERCEGICVPCPPGASQVGCSEGLCVPLACNRGLVLCARGTACCHWLYETVKLTGTAPTPVDIAIDQQDSPHVALADLVSQRGVGHAHKASGRWVIEDVEATAANRVAIGISAQNGIELSFSKPGAMDANLMWAESSNGTTFVVSLVAVDASNFDMLLVATGKPQWAYFSEGILYYRAWVNQQWMSEPVSANAKRAPVAMAVDRDGKLHIAYERRESDGNRWMSLATRDHGWSSLDAHTGGASSGCGLAFDPRGMPFLCFVSEATSQLQCATASSPDSTFWTTTTVDVTTSLWGTPSLAIDPITGELHLSYSDSNGGKLKYAHGRPGNWSVEIVDGNGGVGGDTALALDSKGNPHIAYSASRVTTLGVYYVALTR